MEVWYNLNKVEGQVSAKSFHILADLEKLDQSQSFQIGPMTHLVKLEQGYKMTPLEANWGVGAVQEHGGLLFEPASV